MEKKSLWEEAREYGWSRIFLSLAPELVPAIENRTANPSGFNASVPCPCHGRSGTDSADRFSLMSNHAESGASMCNACGPFLNGFETLAWVFQFRDEGEKIRNRSQLKTEFKDMARERVASFLDHPTSLFPSLLQRIAHRKDSKQHFDDLRSLMEDIWDFGQENHPKMVEYFQKKGISDPELTNYMRFVSMMPDWKSWTVRYREAIMFPLVRLPNAFKDEDFQIVGMARHYLEGPSEHSERIFRFGSLKGSVFPLYPGTGDTLILTNGIWNAMMLKEKTGQSAWATLDTRMWPDIEFPENIETIILAPDFYGRTKGDGDLVKKVSESIRKEGRQCHVVVPDMFSHVKGKKTWFDGFRENPEMAEKAWEMHILPKTPSVSAHQ